MNGKQQAVMWMGLTLVLLRLFTTNQWKDIWATILKGGGSTNKGLKIPGLPPIPTDPRNPIPGGGIPGLLGINAPANSPSSGGVFNA